MLDLLNIEYSATIQVLLAIAVSLAVVCVGVIVVRWLIQQLAILFKWVMKGLVAAALTRVLWEWISMKVNLSEAVRTLLL